MSSDLNRFLHSTSDLRLLYLNELMPADTTASAAILSRHMKACRTPWTLVSEQDLSVPRILQSVRNHLLRRFFPATAVMMEQSFEIQFAATNLAARLAGQKLDVVLTLAHGRLGLHAWRVAQKLGLPLVTIFHDWWPELFARSLKKKNASAGWLERDFADLQRNSDLCLAVCEGMAEHLTHAKCTQVLYPIPESDLTLVPLDRPQGDVFRVTYTGSLWYPYGEMVSKLASVLAGKENIQFCAYGERSYLPVHVADEMESRGQLKPFVPRDQYRALISEGSDMLLAVMGQDAQGQRRMQTSFPSKVVNYFQTGNATLLWAPQNASLGRFARSHGLQMHEESLDPVAAAERIIEMASCSAELQRARQESRLVADKCFHPELLQQTFSAALRRVTSERV